MNRKDACYGLLIRMVYSVADSPMHVSHIETVYICCQEIKANEC